MQITTLRAGLGYRVYLAAGSQLHLSVGAISIKTEALSGDPGAGLTRVGLSEGASYRVQRGGWLQICAQQRSEILTELPEPTAWQRFWRSWSALRRITRSAAGG